MSIEKMELVNVAGLLEDLDQTLLRCCDSGCFHMESALQDVGDGRGFTALHEENPYVPTLKRLYSLAGSLNFKLESADYSSLKENDLQLDEYVSNLEGEFRDLREKIRVGKQEISQREQALIQVKHLDGLNVDFQKIFALTHIGVRFGKLPADSFNKLEYYQNRPFVFVPYERGKEFFWGAYFVPNEEKQIVDSIFDSLYFERVRVPDFVRGTAEDAVKDLTDELAALNAELSESTAEMEKLLKERRSDLNKVFSKLKFLHDTFELRKEAVVMNGKFYLVGFIPLKSAKTFMGLFDDLPGVSVILSPPELDQRITPPTKLKNNIFSNPFAMFVEMYGLPAYNGFNPTMFVAITYTLLFGAMFGDLGQGLVIAAVGFVLYRLKKNAIGQIMLRIGVSSACFGLLYGSVFGYEHALTPLYQMIGFESKPLEVFAQTNTVLIGAIALGAILILISILINIFIGFKQKDYERAIFGNNGIAGFVFYLAILVGMVCQMVLGIPIFNAPYILIFCVIPALIMFFRVPLGRYFSNRHSEEEHEGIGTFIAENFFELFEYILSYVTNTVSFLRVGGFVLSHAGMMLVVMTLSEMVAEGMSPVVVIIGNIFVMCMEGMIVAIQSLRLEFYELFSRFYEGDGHAFRPVGVNYESDSLE